MGPEERGGIAETHEENAMETIQSPSLNVGVQKDDMAGGCSWKENTVPATEAEDRCPLDLKQGPFGVQYERVEGE
jgi:hypothetical protein